MSKKKKEGSEQQKRQAAREARRAASGPSAVGATTGASKQRDHLGAHDDQVETLKTIRQGKQQLAEQHVADPARRRSCAAPA